MSLEDWKQAYSRLEPATRKALARWIVEQELGSGTAAAGTLPPSLARRAFGVPVRAAVVLGVILLAGLAGWRGLQWQRRHDAERARMTAAQRDAEEAKKPRSPKNLEFLQQHVGREITVTGIPELAEVGFLFFSKNKQGALRLNLMPGGVVLMQSAELEELVAQKTGLTVTGVVEKADDGALEIRVASLGQLRKRAQ